VDPASITRRIDTRSGPIGTGEIDPKVVPTESAAGIVSVLVNAAFRRLWLAQAFSQTAQNMIWWALFVQIGHLTNSTLGLGFGILMVQIPTILFAGLSGILTDRFSKRAILVWSNAVRAVGCLGYLAFVNNVGALYAITFCVAVVNQPFQPAETATIPLLVEKHQLMSANALFQITFLSSQVVGFLLGPTLVALPGVGISRTFLVGVIMLAIAAVVLVPLPAITRRRREVASESLGHAAIQMFREMVEVSMVLAKDVRLGVAMIQLSLAPAILLVLTQLGPKYVQQLLGTGTTNAMIILIAPAGVGLGLGLVLIDRFVHRLPKHRVAAWATIAMGLAIGALAILPNVTGVLLSNWHVSRTLGASLMTIPISFVLGVAASLLNAPAQTIVQERADVDLRGRVFALQLALGAAITIPPIIAVGLVGQVLNDMSRTMGVLAVVVVVAGILTGREWD